MNIKIVENQENWDNWIKDNQIHTPFAQSWAWGNILAAEDKKIERLAVVEGEEVLAQVLVVYNDLSLGMKYAFCPKGPIISYKHEAISYKILELLGNYLQKKNNIFLRIEPRLDIKNTACTLHLTADINPSATLILDLEKTEEEILQNMHTKTRYNIRLAEKKGLIIKKEKNFGEFFRLMKKTGERDSFRLHNEKHYQKILDSSYSLQFTAYSSGKAIATAVFIGFGNTFTYLYGASDYEYRKLMTPNLLQWEGIKLGKSLGYKFYDFFGIAPIEAESRKPRSKVGVPYIASGSKVESLNEFEYDKNHQYAGVTRFKLGFGGEYHKNPGTFDLVINKNKYNLYKFLRVIRRFLNFFI